MRIAKARPGDAPSSSSEPPAPANISTIDVRALLEAIPAGVYTTDAAGRITYCNEAAVQIWGRRPELGKSRWCGSWKMFLSDGTPLPLEQCPMAMALNERRPLRGIQAIIERPDGARVWVTPHPTPMFDPSGALIGAVNMFVDVTERKRDEDVLRMRRAELEAVIDGTPFMLARLGRDMRYRFISRAYARMIARSPEEVIGKHAVDVLGEEGFAAVRPHIEKVLRGESSE